MTSAPTLNLPWIEPTTKVEMASESHRHFTAASAPGAMQVEHCDIPAELTIGEWRKACAAERKAARDSRPGLKNSLRRALLRR